MVPILKFHDGIKDFRFVLSVTKLLLKSTKITKQEKKAEHLKKTPKTVHDSWNIKGNIKSTGNIEQSANQRHEKNLVMHATNNLDSFHCSITIVTLLHYLPVLIGVH